MGRGVTAKSVDESDPIASTAPCRYQAVGDLVGASVERRPVQRFVICDENGLSCAPASMQTKDVREQRF